MKVDAIYKDCIAIYLLEQKASECLEQAAALRKKLTLQCETKVVEKVKTPQLRWAGGPQARTIELMKADSAIVWSPKDLAERLSIKAHHSGFVLRKLKKNGFITKVGRGQYKYKAA